MMDRRRFLLSWLAGAVAAPMIAGAQQPQGRPRQVAVLYGAPTKATLAQQRAFDEVLAAAGHSVGRGVVVIHRGTDATTDDVTKAVEDVFALRPEIIVAWSTVVSVAVKRMATTTPVVFLAVGFPI